MNKCPHCGADIQEDAKFCLYCMETLNEKKNITPKKRRGLLLPVFFAAGGLLLALCVTFLLIFVGNEIKSTRDGNAEKPGSQDTSKDLSDSADVAFFEDVKLRATYLTGKNGLSELWDPDSFILTHEMTDSDGDVWEIYSPDVYLNGVYISVSVCEGGEEVLTTVSGITDETREDALLICECLISSVSNYTYDNLSDLLRDERKYPMAAVEDGASLASLAEMKEPEATLYDENSEPLLKRMSIDITRDGTVDMFYDKRTRTYEKKTYYDIYFLHFCE